jgi:hypothetical protein
MSRSISIGLSLPAKLVHRLDRERGDIPRSRFVVRILERVYLNPGTNFEATKQEHSGQDGFEARILDMSRDP